MVFSQNTVEVQVNCVKFEFECFHCGKHDVYYYPIPAHKVKSKFKSAEKDVFLTSEYAKYDPWKLISLEIVNEAQRYSYKYYNKVTQPTKSWLVWFTGSEFSLNPGIQAVDGCKDNYGGKHDIKTYEPEVVNIIFNFDKTLVDREINKFREQEQKVIENNKINESRQEKFIKIQSEIKTVLYDKIFVGYNMALNKDTTGIDTISRALDRIAVAFGSDFNFNYVMKIDSFEFSFLELFNFYALSHLYAGAYAKGIRNITKAMERNKKLNNDDFNVYLAMAYLMNCQTLKATAKFNEIMLHSQQPCSIYGKVDKLIDDMREAHPDLKCIGKLKTIPIMALLICSN
jgi:hypothetical protein